VKDEIRTKIFHFFLNYFFEKSFYLIILIRYDRRFFFIKVPEGLLKIARQFIAGIIIAGVIIAGVIIYCRGDLR